LESSAAGSADETGSEGGEAGAMARSSVIVCVFSIACISVFC
jgi:hypothetical protein